MAYIYAENPTTPTQEKRPDVTSDSLDALPRDIIHLMREAVIAADLDQLLATIRQVEACDPCTARGLRGLAEQFEYQKLLDLFGPGVAPAISSPTSGTAIFPIPG
jgi:hypothetical protein